MNPKLAELTQQMAAAADAANVDLAELVHDVTATLTTVVTDASLLSESDAKLLDSVGVTHTDNSRHVVRQSVASSVATHRGSYSVPQAADILNVGPSRVRQQLNSERTLIGFKSPATNRWQIPDWNFYDRQAIPGLDAVAKSLPDDLNPIVVAGIINTPNPDLVIDGVAVSVHDWLLSGRDAAAAVQAIGDPADLA